MKYAITLLVALMFTAPAVAQPTHSHNHNHKVDFMSLDEGWSQLEMVAAEIKAAVKAENLEALHDLSDQLHAVAEGLKRFNKDVPKPNQMRYTSSLNQILSLSDRLHQAYERNDLVAAQRLVPQLNGMVQLLMASAES
ncbi:MAG: hypothetical protein RIC29_05770 [Rhodospirillaceae bacterium]